ncbi:tyrosine-type recombinase/integrase, partial [Escherichia coli]|uniref:tyrosine-type recombinase/integrase n=1 Tax=Escherichia coli TaxID=562 RepID=UPI001FFFA80D|nr:tyrosine-type recombinase/integrase [Escherichia coli]
DRNRSHWSTSKTPSYTKSVSWQHHPTSGGNAGLSLEIHPHMLRHSCGFALANMGIDTRLIQDYLGHRNIRHTVWYTASNAGRFYGIWDRARGRQRHAVL